MKLGDCPNIMFIPAADPLSGQPLTNKTLIICNPYLYVYIRDLVIANETARDDQNADAAMAKMMQEIMKYKPLSQRTEGERKLGPLSIRLEEHYPNPKSLDKEQADTDNMDDVDDSD